MKGIARRVMPLAVAGSFVLALVLCVLGLTRPMSNAVDAFGFALRSHAASGQLQVVEMDAASIDAIDRYPWSRRHYANVIDRLDAAGAASIVFDVDFSTPSAPADDAAMAAAVRRAGGIVVLPTFAQSASHADRRSIDALPIAALRDDAVLAAVSVSPDRDGLVRRMLLGIMTAGTPRPSLSAYIASRNGTADAQFPIDYGIDAATIPRLSFTDIEHGRFDPGAVRGKSVLIGATAIEMGDRYAVPRHGMLPGVIVQALAAETLFRNVPVEVGAMPLLLLAMLLVILPARSRSIGRALAWGAASVGLLFALHLAGWETGWVVDMVPAALAIAMGTGARCLELAAQRRQHRRMHDAETGLANRLALVRDAGGGQDGLIVAAFIDGYDRLAAVLGSADAAELVKRVADRLALAAGDATLYRAEDRALAWSTDIGQDQLEQQLSGAARIMRAPIEIGSRRVDVLVGFGIAEAPGIAEAMLAAGEAVQHKTIWHYHAESERVLLDRDISLMGELDTAIENGELAVVYQPKLDLSVDAITSAEALVRWYHPTRGFLSPDAFIPMAERSDRIHDLTLYVLARAIEDIDRWRAQGLDLRVAVNISARLVASAVFGDAIRAILAAMTVPADRLIFEVTESATLDDPDAAAAALHAFSAMGVTISMDDYGTGQSTLTYLRQLPLGELKIDRSFVQHAHENRSDAVLVRSTIELAHELSIRVVAEGVEDEPCLDFLRSVGCDYAQGYLVGKPMPAADLFGLVQGERKVAA